jgi:hypothetical protein
MFKRNTLFLLFLIMSLFSLSQDKPGLNGGYTVFPDDVGFRFFDKEFSYFTTDGSNFETYRHNLDLPDLRFKYIPNNSNNYLISAGGGTVYTYNDTVLRRVDESFAFQSRYSSFNFAKGDTIISIGGSGEFNVQNNIIYFSPLLKEWLVEYRYDSQLKTNNIAIGQYDVFRQMVFFNLSNSNEFDQRSRIEVLGDFPSEIFSYDFNSKQLRKEFTLESLFKDFFPNPESPRLRRFDEFLLPLLYDEKEVISFDFSSGQAIRYLNPDIATLIQYPEIVSYNPRSNNFLLTYGRGSEGIYLVINEAVLLGTDYQIIKLKRVNAFPWWLSVLILPLGIFVFMKRRSVPLVESLDRITPQLRRILSEEDFKIFQIIREYYPNGVEYPDLQSSFERELSYESRIKKLRNTIAHIDETAQSIIGKSSSVFDITKGKEDKRVKVIRVKDDEVFQYWWIKKASKKKL